MKAPHLYVKKNMTKYTILKNWSNFKVNVTRPKSFYVMKYPLTRNAHMQIKALSLPIRNMCPRLRFFHK